MEGSPAQLLTAARRAAGLSASTLAAKARVPTSTVTRIEKGTTDPTFGTLARLLEAADFEFHPGIRRRSGALTTLASLASAADGNGDLTGPSGSALKNYRDDLGNHITRPAHHDRVTDAHILAVQVGKIVQGRVADCRPTDKDRIQARNGGQCAGSSDLEVDRLDATRPFFSGKLVRNRPPRGARHKAQFLLTRIVIDLVDHAIDVKSQSVTTR